MKSIVKEFNAFEVVIIGGGPAGLAAALSLAYDGRSVCVIERAPVGGACSASNYRLENVVGWEGSAIGFIEKGREQCEALGVKFRHDTINDVTLENGHYVVHGTVQNYTGKSVILATGTRPRRADYLPLDAMVEEADVTYDMGAAMHWAQHSNIMIVGDGNAAAQAALSMSAIAKYDVRIRSSFTFTSDTLRDRVKMDTKLQVDQTSEPLMAWHDEDARALLKTRPNGRPWYILVASGRSCDLPSFVEARELADKPGVFFAGDCVTSTDMRVMIAMGAGAGVARSVHRFLDALEQLCNATG